MKYSIFFSLFNVLSIFASWLRVCFAFQSHDAALACANDGTTTQVGCQAIQFRGGAELFVDGNASVSLLQHQAEFRSADKLVQLANAKVGGEMQKGGVCGIMWFYHIPKSGGLTVEHSLLELTKAHQLQAVYMLGSRGDHSDWIWREGLQLDDGRVNFTAFHGRFIAPFAKDPRNRLVAVHHHDRGPGLLGLNAYFSKLQEQLQSKGCELWRVTFLRNPTDIMLSALFYYDKAHTAHPEYAPINVRNVSDQNERFRIALATDKKYDNFMLRYLLSNLNEDTGSRMSGLLDIQSQQSDAVLPMKLGNVGPEAVKLAKQILQSFDYVGRTEELESGLSDVYQMLHLPGDLSIGRENSNKHKNLAQLPKDIQMLIQQRTQVDWQLYWNSTKQKA